MYFFNDLLVAARVMDKQNHRLKKTTLELRFVYPEEKIKQCYKLNQLAIHGLPKGIERDVLEFTIGERLNMEEDDFSLQVSEETTIIIFVKDYTTTGMYIIIILNSQLTLFVRLMYVY